MIFDKYKCRIFSLFLLDITYLLSRYNDVYLLASRTNQARRLSSIKIMFNVVTSTTGTLNLNICGDILYKCAQRPAAEDRETTQDETRN